MKKRAVEFYKVQASGNDFVLIDMRRPKGRVHGIDKDFIVSGCDRKFGIGADGMLVLVPSKKADFRLRIFNADGSEAEMCGNGARCAALYSAQRRRAQMAFETLAGIIRAEVKDDMVKVQMTDPFDSKLNFPIEVCGRRIRAHYINTGVPHAVIFVEDAACIDVAAIGRAVRRHPFFAPKGTNVNFVQVVADNKIIIRTYERGVEAETLACGTGTAAACVITHCALQGDAISKKQSVIMHAQVRGNERLTVYFDREEKLKFSNVWLEGTAQCVFEGRMFA